MAARWAVEETETMFHGPEKLTRYLARRASAFLFEISRIEFDHGAGSTAKLARENIALSLSYHVRDLGFHLLKIHHARHEHGNHDSGRQATQRSGCECLA
jgi:hypothetical protein